jgi:serine/threonine-protein kinase RsbW
MVEVRIPSEWGGEQIATDVAGTVAQRLGFPPQRIAALKTAVEEACLNAIEHGNGLDRRRRVVVRFTEWRDRLEVWVMDSGRGCWSKALTMPPPDLNVKLSGQSPPRGWGLCFIQNLVDEVEFLKSSKGGHQLRMVIYRQPTEEG